MRRATGWKHCASAGRTKQLKKWSIVELGDGKKVDHATCRTQGSHLGFGRSFARTARCTGEEWLATASIRAA
jgi:hypothetical protein